MKISKQTFDFIIKNKDRMRYYEIARIRRISIATVCNYAIGRRYFNDGNYIKTKKITQKQIDFIQKNKDKMTYRAIGAAIGMSFVTAYNYATKNINLTDQEFLLRKEKKQNILKIKRKKENKTYHKENDGDFSNGPFFDIEKWAKQNKI